MKDLREFIGKLEELGELRLIEGADWDLEIGAVTYLAAKGPNPPSLLFDKIKGYPPSYRVFVNSYPPDNRRIALTLGLSLEASKLEFVRKVRDKLNEPLLLVPPLQVKKGPIMENVYLGNDVDLFKFPTPKWQLLDGGRYLGTGDNIIARDPDEGWVNISTQRLQIHDKSTATLWIEPGKHLDMIRRKYWKRGEGCPIAVTCGQHPIFVVAGSLRVPWGISEYEWLGWWMNEPVEVIKGPITGLPIPAHAEIALEGKLVPIEEESRIEGPFSEWTGHYSAPRREPAFKVEGMLHRNDPIILGSLPFISRGRMNSVSHIIKAAQVWKQLDTLVPGIKGVWQYFEMGGTNNLVISLEQKYGGHAKQAALAALAQMSYMTKIVIIVDDDVDPSDLHQVLWAVGLRSEPEDWEIIKGMWTSPLEPSISASKRGAGDLTHSAVIILACKPYGGAEDYPPVVDVDGALEQKVREKWGKLVL